MFLREGKLNRGREFKNVFKFSSGEFENVSSFRGGGNLNQGELEIVTPGRIGNRKIIGAYTTFCFHYVSCSLF